MKKSSNFLMLLLLCSLYACKLPVKVAKGNVYNKIDEFYKGASTMYFVKPLQYHKSINIDITLECCLPTNDSLTFNLSLYDREIQKNIDKIKFISNGATAYECSNIKNMFTSPKGKYFVNRFTMSFPKSQIKTWLLSENSSLVLTLQNKENVYISSKDWRKVANEIKKLQLLNSELLN